MSTRAPTALRPEAERTPSPAAFGPAAGLHALLTASAGAETSPTVHSLAVLTTEVGLAASCPAVHGRSKRRLWCYRLSKTFVLHLQKTFWLLVMLVAIMLLKQLNYATSNTPMSMYLEL